MDGNMRRDRPRFVVFRNPHAREEVLASRLCYGWVAWGLIWFERGAILTARRYGV
jgi:hypothetical protein